MKKLQVPEFKSYEEEVEFWDNLDTAEYMEDDGEWFHFETDKQRAAHIAILPVVLVKLRERAQTQGVSVETLANVLLLESLRETNSAVAVVN